MRSSQVGMRLVFSLPVSAPSRKVLGGCSVDMPQQSGTMTGSLGSPGAWAGSKEDHIPSRRNVEGDLDKQPPPSPRRPFV